MMKNIIYMKYGVHASESIESIVKRKQEEISKTGYTLWGYGGNLCHPQNQVQPFAKEVSINREKLFLVMSFTESKLNNSPQRSNLFSLDGVEWNKINDEIDVLGSKHALCINKLQLCDFDLVLNQYVVGIGKRKGVSLASYIRYRVDKACAIKSELDVVMPDLKKAHITLMAEIISPFAVFTKI